jgi:Fe-S cluster assembly protein SufB
MTMNSDQITIDTSAVERFVQQKYRHGFVTEIESETVLPGLNEDVIRWISARKQEPEWLLEWRLEAYRRWLQMEQPDWAHLKIAPIDFQAISYFSAPKSDKDRPQSLDEVDPRLLETYDKLGVPLHERARLAGVAVDAVFDSVSVGTTFRAAKSGRDLRPSPRRCVNTRSWCGSTWAAWCRRATTFSPR